MSQVKVNKDMKKEAGEQFLRISAQREDHGENNKEIKNIMENVESSMFQIKSIKSSKTDKTKLEIKLNESKLSQN
jgi:formylmethanofuran dehydrogenase subunit E